MPTKTASVLFALAALAGAQPAAAKAESFRVDYSVSLLGLNIARSSFTSTITGDTFTINGELASSGIAKVFDSTTGTATVSGNFTSNVPNPNLYLLNYTSGKKRKKTEIAFSNGAVTHTENVPPTRKRTDWVDVNQSDLSSVADPISATVVRASSMEDVCKRTIKVYDGEIRADLALSFVNIGPAEARGFSGNAVTCQAKFSALGGYRKNNRSIRFLENRSRILIAFAQFGDTGVYAPIRLSATTEIGTIVVQARRFEMVK